MAVSLAGGFVGAILLTMGFSLAQTLLFYALLLGGRLLMRFAALALVRRLGYKYAIILGVALSAAQFISLARAEDWRWLLAWIATLALAESLYWPVFHSASAVVGHNAVGRELGIRSAVTALVNVVGPAAGGLILSRYGTVAEFTLAGIVTILSIAPLLGLKRILAGPVPEMRHAARSSDYRGTIVFAADGWMSAGITIAWPMVLFLSLGSHYESLGFANAVAGLAGAFAGLYSGRVIDRGGRNRSAKWITGALAISIGLRACADWSPLAAAVANATGAMVMGFYVPILMSVMYAGAKRSSGAFAFHVSAEGGWDVGAATGCLIAAAIASATESASLALLPSALAVIVLYRTLRGMHLPPLVH